MSADKEYQEGGEEGDWGVSRCSAFSFLCSFWTILATMALAVCCSVRVGSRWSRQQLSGSMRYTLVVWSISQLPFFGPSSQYTRLALILNFRRHSRSSMSSSLVPVTPIMFLPNSVRQLFMTLGESRSGSTETKTSFNFMYAPSGRLRMMRQTEERQQRELGQMSGQLVQPKQRRQQLPVRFLLEKGIPSEFVSVQSPPIARSLCFSSLKPEMSSSRVSRLASLRLLAEQQKQASALVSRISPPTPNLVTPSQVFPSISSSTGEDFRFFCSCIIHASCLFRGAFPFYSENRMRMECVRREGRREEKG